MKNLTIFTAIALGMFVLGACGKDNSSDVSDNMDLILGRDEQKEIVERDLTVQSKLMDQQMKYSVWLPEGYSKKRSYPILYLLHGAGGNQNSWLDDGLAQQFASSYVKESDIPIIIVMPDGQMTFFSGNWESYFHKELMPKVEATYSFNGQRAIAGLSMGGYGTLYHALKYPDKFVYAYAMSPAVFGSMNSFVDSQNDKTVFPKFTIEVGTEDTVVNNDSAEALSEYLNANNVICDWIERTGFHTWDFWKECLPKALEVIGNEFKEKQ